MEVYLKFYIKKQTSYLFMNNNNQMFLTKY